MSSVDVHSVGAAVVLVESVVRRRRHSSLGSGEAAVCGRQLHSLREQVAWGAAHSAVASEEQLV